MDWDPGSTLKKWIRIQKFYLLTTVMCVLRGKLLNSWLWLIFGSVYMDPHNFAIPDADVTDPTGYFVSKGSSRI